MIPDSSSGENSSAWTTERERADGVQLANALALHAAMVTVRLELPRDGPHVSSLDLSGFVSLLGGRAVPWPQISELKSFALRFQESEDGESFNVQDVYEELLNLTNDLAIWIVERYYRPASPSAVSQLNPDLQQAGLGYLLYKCYENERQWLDEEELAAFQRLFERWINAIWDGNIKLPLPAEIQTIGQLIRWLANRNTPIMPSCIQQTILELTEQT
jgi:hypothetical protein